MKLKSSALIYTKTILSREKQKGYTQVRNQGPKLASARTSTPCTQLASDTIWASEVKTCSPCWLRLLVLFSAVVGNSCLKQLLPYEEIFEAQERASLNIGTKEGMRKNVVDFQ